MSTEGTAWPSGEGARSRQGFSSPRLSSDPALEGETGAPGRSHQAPGVVTMRPLGSTELCLANTFVPLLLLTWLPAGESTTALASALNSELFAYACRRCAKCLLLLLPILLHHLAPLLPQHLAMYLAEGSPLQLHVKPCELQAL